MISVKLQTSNSINFIITFALVVSFFMFHSLSYSFHKLHKWNQHQCNWLIYKKWQILSQNFLHDFALVAFLIQSGSDVEKTLPWYLQLHIDIWCKIRVVWEVGKFSYSQKRWWIRPIQREIRTETSWNCLWKGKIHASNLSILLQITKKNADTRIQQQKFVILFYQILACDNEIACYGIITDYCCLIAYIALGYSINLLVSYNLKVLTNKEFKRKLFPEISTI